MNRDPRTDPRPGDVVESADSLGACRFVVLARRGHRVVYGQLPSGTPDETTLREWQESAASDRMVYAAPLLDDNVVQLRVVGGAA